MSLYQWLDKIEARPGLYLRRPGFESLCAFFLGYDAALLSSNAIERDFPPFGIEFSKFVLTRLPRPAGDTMSDFGLLVHQQTGETKQYFCGPNWQTTIENAVPDDQERFRLFFALLHEYRNGKADA